MIIGVTQGFSKTLEINGVGYRAAKQGQNINFTLRFLSPGCKKSRLQVSLLRFLLRNKIVVSGADKEVVGAVAADIRTLAST